MAERRRIAVVGASGSGKTTLAREVAGLLGVRYVELDEIQHGPNWAETPDDVFRARVAEVVAEEQWVIDGNYERKIGDDVVAAADTVVWLDFPLPLILRRLWVRTRERIRDDVELWAGNKEDWRSALWGRDSLFAWTIRSHRAHRKAWPARIARLQAAGVETVRLRSPEEVARWLATI
jgi:adenylate kinase family enzyme